VPSEAFAEKDLVRFSVNYRRQYSRTTERNEAVNSEILPFPFPKIMAIQYEESPPTDVEGLSPYGVAGGTLGVLALVLIGYHVFEQDIRVERGKNWKWHAVYWVIAVPIIFFVPHSVTQYVFSNLTMTVVGFAVPVYESLRAVCTPEEEDDKAWLQYWM